MKRYCFWMSPLGPLRLAQQGEALTGLVPTDQPLPEPWQEGDSALLSETRRQLAQYFAAQRREFTIPMKTNGTEFQRRCWQVLCTIPYGETRTYGWQAREVGNPKAVRAVGAANGANPIAILIPCHRVVGAKGQLTGYAYGLEMKQFLLDLECR